MALWAIVPVKGLATAKGRLASLLAPDERAALVAALLTDVLAGLHATPGIAQVLVVSPDPAALTLAASLGAMPLAEPLVPTACQAHWPGEDAGLNAALDFAAQEAIAGGATALLALPADLPRITPGDVLAVCAARPAAPSVVLAPTTDGGTGALLREPPLALAARFGVDSLRAHLQAAAAAGVAARLVWRRNLSLDVDRPADLEHLAAVPHPSHTHALLAELQARGRWRAPAALVGSPPR